MNRAEIVHKRKNERSWVIWQRWNHSSEALLTILSQKGEWRWERREDNDEQFLSKWAGQYEGERESNKEGEERVEEKG